METLTEENSEMGLLMVEDSSPFRPKMLEVILSIKLSQGPLNKENLQECVWFKLVKSRSLSFIKKESKFQKTMKSELNVAIYGLLLSLSSYLRAFMLDCPTI